MRKNPESMTIVVKKSDPRFADLGHPRRVWAVASIHGEAERLMALHDQLGSRFQPGDRVVYLGNYLGRGPRIIETVDELLLFRRSIMAAPGVFAADIVFLRGAQEEMWHKTLQLHLAPDGGEVLRWMDLQGLGATLSAYGSRVDQGLAAVREGAVAVARWANGLRAALRARPGHDQLMSALRRAAFTADRRLLLVHSGFNAKRSLEDQADSFWWASNGFIRRAEPWGSFVRVVRGYDPDHAGVRVGPHTTSLDAGCGFGGKLVAAAFTPDGELTETLEA